MRLLLTLFLTTSISLAFSQSWEKLKAKGEATPRHENSAVAIGDKFYVLGGRGIKSVDVFDTKTNTWSSLAETPIEIHHFQAVTYDGEIYVLGALTGGYPHEKPISHIYIFNPDKNEWRKGAEIPRKRGGAGVFVYQNKIYMVSGIVDGHWTGHVTWFDAYDPATGRWYQLPDAPRARDHISAAVIADQVVLAGGRRSSAKSNQVMSLTESNVDIFDFTTHKWRSAPKSGHIPTMRAGASAVTFRGKAVILGGESSAQVPAHSEVEAFDPATMTWTSLPSMKTTRHGTGAAVIDGKIYTAAGSKNRGGGPELNEIEVFSHE